MRKLVLVTLFLLISGAGLWYTFRGDIAVAILERAVERSMGADFQASLPDGLHVGLCGAGAPMPDADRSGPCVAVLAGRSLFVVDAGSGGGRNLQRMGLVPGNVEALFLTHFHSDHIDGLGELALLRWTTGGRREPLPVHGPTGVDSVVAGFNAAYALDFGYRSAHHGSDVAPPQGAGSSARGFPPPAAGEGSVVWETQAVTITAFAVPHDPASPAVGYRFDYRGRSLVISGDTARSDNLARFARDVDLLVHEALAPRLVAIMNRAAGRAGRGNIEQITDDILSYHATPTQAAEVATAAGARHLLYYHVLPPLPPIPGLTAAFLEGVDDAYAGGVTVGRDGTFVSLPAGSDEILVSSRL